jgi:hypothetical protein
MAFEFGFWPILLRATGSLTFRQLTKETRWRGFRKKRVEGNSALVMPRKLSQSNGHLRLLLLKRALARHSPIGLMVASILFGTMSPKTQYCLGFYRSSQRSDFGAERRRIS